MSSLLSLEGCKVICILKRVSMTFFYGLLVLHLDRAEGFSIEYMDAMS